MTTTEYVPQADPHCFVCSRHTDHFAEHDALVDAGLAEYESDGTVVKTSLWDATLAAKVVEAEWQEYKKTFPVGTFA